MTSFLKSRCTAMVMRQQGFELYIKVLPKRRAFETIVKPSALDASLEY